MCQFGCPVTGRSSLVTLSELLLSLSPSWLPSLLSAPCPPAQFPAIPALPKSTEHLLGDEPWQGWWHGDTEHVLAQGVLLVARNVKQSLPPCMSDNNDWSTSPMRSRWEIWGCLAWRGGGSGGILAVSKTTWKEAVARWGWPLCPTTSDRTIGHSPGEV